MSLRKKVQQDDFEWFEVWFDDGLRPPYFLILFKKKNLELYIIADLMTKYHIEAEFNSYDEAVSFLREDEYSQVKGREELAVD